MLLVNGRMSVGVDWGDIAPVVTAAIRQWRYMVGHISTGPNLPRVCLLPLCDKLCFRLYSLSGWVLCPTGAVAARASVETEDLNARLASIEALVESVAPGWSWSFVVLAEEVNSPDEVVLASGI